MKNRSNLRGTSTSKKLNRAVGAAIESLESRRLMSVTLDNGLATDSADYFSVTVDEAGSTRNTTFGSTDTIFDYFAYLDTGTAAYALHSFGSDPVQNPDGSVRSQGAITVTGGATVRFEVVSTLPSGSKAYYNKYTFTSTDYDLTQARLYQYMDSDIVGISDDVLKVDGTTNGTGADKLILTTIDPATDIRQAQSDANVSVNAALTGWGADEFSTLRSEVSGGGYDAAPDGTLDTVSLPPTTVPGIGDVYGPNDVTTVLEYTFTSSTSASVTTLLGIDTVAAVAPEIDVQGNGISVLSGDLLPATEDGTDFGTVFAGPAAQTFDIRNIGSTTLTLSGSPIVEISGANASDFVVTTQPSGSVASGQGSTFTIEFTPGALGLRTATVTILSDDANEGTYSFSIQGTGTDVPPTDDPIADAGGPYTINVGDDLDLDGSGSSDPNGDPLTYTWDINGDGIFGDATGATPTVTWVELNALGITDPGLYSVIVRVSDGTATIDSSPASLTILDDTLPPVDGTQLAIQTASVTEGTGAALTSVSIEVIRTGDLTGTSTVKWVAVDGSASESDFNIGSGFITFAAGETSKFIDLSVVADSTKEGTESFRVLLTKPTGATIIDSNGKVTILDDDADSSPLTVSILDWQRKEGNHGTKALRFSVRLNRAALASETVSVDYATAPGTALDGSDYVGSTGTVTFAAGSKRATITIDLASDLVAEGDETFSVNLITPVNVSIVDGDATGTIINDD